VLQAQAFTVAFPFFSHSPRHRHSVISFCQSAGAVLLCALTNPSFPIDILSRLLSHNTVSPPFLTEPSFPFGHCLCPLSAPQVWISRSPGTNDMVVLPPSGTSLVSLSDFVQCRQLPFQSGFLWLFGVTNLTFRFQLSITELLPSLPRGTTWQLIWFFFAHFSRSKPERQALFTCNIAAGWLRKVLVFFLPFDRDVFPWCSSHWSILLYNVMRW